MRSASAASTAAVHGPRTTHAVARSIRVTAVSPEVWAMSVAFDDHGEIVPRRGTT
jgi:hypothetical protein